MSSRSRVDRLDPARPRSEATELQTPVGPGPRGTGLAVGVREGGDGDEVCMDADVLFEYLDFQSRSLREFIRFAKGGGNGCQG